MKEIIKKLKLIEQETTIEKGGYDLFALFLREGSPNKWDILVAANWIDTNKEAALRYMAHKIQNTFTESELLHISRIVIIAENDPELARLQQSISDRNETSEIKDANLFGLHIKQAFVITSKNSLAA